MTADVLWVGSVPGAAGALAWFLLGIRRGRIRNNHYIRKGLLEAFGGTLVASFIAYPTAPIFSVSTPVIVIAFASGSCWAGVLQTLRRWITQWYDQNLRGGGV